MTCETCGHVAGRRLYRDGKWWCEWCIPKAHRVEAPHFEELIMIGPYTGRRITRALREEWRDKSYSERIVDPKTGKEEIVRSNRRNHTRKTFVMG